MVEGRIRFAGMICLIGGILWVITLALLAGVTVGSPLISLWKLFS